MKPDTLLLFHKHIKRFEIDSNQFKHDLSDDEIAEIVYAEYGPSQQSVPDLFEVIVKKLVKESLK